MLKNRKIGVFITGGIASYKVADFVRQLIKQGAEVRVAMSQSATEFITPLTFQVLTKHAVLTDTFAEHTPAVVQHVEMADWCEFAVVIPATANILSKMSHGIADDVVSTTLLALHCPRLIVPAMNVNMYHNPATQRNIAQLQQDGYVVMEPDTGFLAEGYHGKGRLPELQRIIGELERVIARYTFPQVLSGLNIVISAGGTRERIDPVRYITNDSSGKMGYALAKTATYLGAHRVTLVSTTRQLPVPNSVTVQYVDDAQTMIATMLELFDQSDIAVMAAAVSDYRVINPQSHKIKKQDPNTQVILQLIENPDILATLGARKKHQTVVGFAAETQHLIEYATRKLHKKNADWIIANDVSNQQIGFNSNDNQVTLLSKDGAHYPLEQMTKEQTALAIWQTIRKE